MRERINLALCFRLAVSRPSYFFFCIFHFLSAHPTVHMYIFSQITQGVWIDPCLAAYMNHIVMIYIYAPPDGRVCMRTDGNAWLIAFGTHNFHALLSLVFVQWRHLTRNRKLDTRQAERGQRTYTDRMTPATTIW